MQHYDTTVETNNFVPNSSTEFDLMLKDHTTFPSKSTSEQNTEDSHIIFVFAKKGHMIV